MDRARTFARNLERARIARGYTRENFALDAGVSLSYLWNIKKGISTPTITKADELADTLKVDLPILLITDLIIESGTEGEDAFIERPGLPSILRLLKTQQSKRKLRP